MTKFIPFAGRAHNSAITIIIDINARMPMLDQFNVTFHVHFV